MISKREMQKLVSQHGKPLAKKLFNWDAQTSTFSSKEDYLIIECNFLTTHKLGRIFITGSRCIFHKVDCYGLFKTGSDCVFNEIFANNTFITNDSCVFHSLRGRDNDIIRCDTKEVISLSPDKTLRLNEDRGYTEQ